MLRVYCGTSVSLSPQRGRLPAPLKQTDAGLRPVVAVGWKAALAYSNGVNNALPLAVHGPDRTVREAAEPEGAAELLQRPERVGLRGGVPAAAHLGLPAARARLLPALHRGRTLRQGVLSASESMLFTLKMPLLPEIEKKYSFSFPLKTVCDVFEKEPPSF